MIGFSESAEYKRKQAERIDAAIAYVYLLGTSPSPTELAEWMTRQKAGVALATLTRELLESPAYAARFA
jgi:hypothetical protein